LADDTVADDDFARLIELAADAVDAVTIIDAQPDDDVEPNLNDDRNTDPDPSDIRSGDDFVSPLIDAMAADVRAMERRVDNSELNDNPKPNLKSKPMRRKPIKRGPLPRHRKNMTVKGAALMDAGAKMGFTISSKEFLHEKGLVNMRNIRNAMGGDDFEENDEAAKRGLPFWITEPDLEAEIQQYIDDDVVPATKEFTDHRGQVYRAMAKDTWYRQDDGTAGAPMEHILIALMQRFPSVRGESDGLHGMLQMVQGKRRIHSYNRERSAAGNRAGEDMNAGLQITLAIDGTSNKNVPGLNMADLRTQLCERRKIEREAGVEWDWDKYVQVSEALDATLAIRASHANRSGSEVYSADERRSLTLGNTVAPVDQQDKARVVAPVGEARDQGDSVDDKISRFHERMVAPKLNKMQGELGELTSTVGSLAGSVKGIESDVDRGWARHLP